MEERKLYTNEQIARIGSRISNYSYNTLLMSLNVMRNREQQDKEITREQVIDWVTIAEFTLEKLL